MKESNLQSKFGVWLKINKMEGVFELKLEKGKSFAFNKVKGTSSKSIIEAKTRRTLSQDKRLASIFRIKD